jgi:hypothetical protein
MVFFKDAVPEQCVAKISLTYKTGLLILHHAKMKFSSKKENFMDGLIFDLRRRLSMKPCNEKNGLARCLMIINVVL